MKNKWFLLIALPLLFYSCVAGKKKTAGVQRGQTGKIYTTLMPDTIKSQKWSLEFGRQVQYYSGGAFTLTMIEDSRGIMVENGVVINDITKESVDIQIKRDTKGEAVKLLNWNNLMIQFDQGDNLAVVPPINFVPRNGRYEIELKKGQYIPYLGKKYVPSRTDIYLKFAYNEKRQIIHINVIASGVDVTGTTPPDTTGR